MPVIIPDLWRDEIAVEELSPAMILNTQASILERKTNGMITAELIRRKTGPVTELTFDLKSQVARHRSRILVCRHLDESVYPVWITSTALHNGASSYLSPPEEFFFEEGEWNMTGEASGQGQFFEIIAMVFKSNDVKSRINFMIAKINETKHSLDHLIIEEVVGGDQPI